MIGSSLTENLKPISSTPTPIASPTTEKNSSEPLSAFSRNAQIHEVEGINKRRALMTNSGDKAPTAFTRIGSSHITIPSCTTNTITLDQRGVTAPHITASLEILDKRNILGSSIFGREPSVILKVTVKLQPPNARFLQQVSAEISAMRKSQKSEDCQPEMLSSQTVFFYDSSSVELMYTLPRSSTTEGCIFFSGRIFLRGEYVTSVRSEDMAQGETEGSMGGSQLVRNNPPPDILYKIKELIACSCCKVGPFHEASTAVLSFIKSLSYAGGDHQLEAKPVLELVNPSVLAWKGEGIDLVQLEGQNFASKCRIYVSTSGKCFEETSAFTSSTAENKVMLELAQPTMHMGATQCKKQIYVEVGDRRSNTIHITYSKAQEGDTKRGSMMPFVNTTTNMSLYRACLTGDINATARILSTVPNSSQKIEMVRKGENKRAKGSCFHAAARSGSCEVFQLLVAIFGSGVQDELLVEDSQGYNCLHVAAHEGHTTLFWEMLQILRRSPVFFPRMGNDYVDIQSSKDKKTALHLACSRGRLRMSCFLLQMGANPTISDERQVLPLDYAVLSGDLRTTLFIAACTYYSMQSEKVPEQVYELVYSNGEYIQFFTLKDYLQAINTPLLTSGTAKLVPTAIVTDSNSASIATPIPSPQSSSSRNTSAEVVVDKEVSTIHRPLSVRKEATDTVISPPVDGVITDDRPPTNSTPDVLFDNKNYEVKLLLKSAKGKDDTYSESIPSEMLCTPYKYDLKVVPEEELLSSASISLDLVESDTRLKVNRSLEPIDITSHHKQERVIRFSLNLCSFHYNKRAFRLAISFADATTGSIIFIKYSSPFKTLARKKRRDVDSMGVTKPATRTFYVFTNPDDEDDEAINVITTSQ